MRDQLAREFPSIVEGFLKGAKSGSCQHVKLATELMKMPERKSASGKGQIRRLVSQLQRE